MTPATPGTDDPLIRLSQVREMLTSDPVIERLAYVRACRELWSPFMRRKHQRWKRLPESVRKSWRQSVRDELELAFRLAFVARGALRIERTVAVNDPRAEVSE